MIETFATHKNVGRFLAGIEVVETPINGRIGMGLFLGAPGTGKSEIALKFAVENGWAYVRAIKNMSHRKLLTAIVSALEEEPMFRKDDLLEQILDSLTERPRVLIVDEVDYLTKGGLVEVLRDINDLTNSPLVMMGMEKVDRKLRDYKHLFDRFSAVVRFHLLDQDDVKSIADDLCNVPVDDDAIKHITEKSGGKLRLITTWLARVRQMARTNKLERIAIEHLQAICVGGE